PKILSASLKLLAVLVSTFDDLTTSADITIFFPAKSLKLEQISSWCLGNSKFFFSKKNFTPTVTRFPLTDWTWVFFSMLAKGPLTSLTLAMTLGQNCSSSSMATGWISSTEVTSVTTIGAKVSFFFNSGGLSFWASDIGRSDFSDLPTFRP